MIADNFYSKWFKIREFFHIQLNDSLDGTGQFRRRVEDDSIFRASGSGINFPLPVILYLIAQLIGSIWWAATMQNKVDNVKEVINELRQENKVLTLQVNKLENGLDERIRMKVRESFDDWGYVRDSNQRKR